MPRFVFGSEGAEGAQDEELESVEAMVAETYQKLKVYQRSPRLKGFLDESTFGFPRFALSDTPKHCSPVSRS
ncbi:hypothetical protein PISMIDRAFT_16683 [Pisolithus microcarpus 441]|uniref:Uncharacterized protein n=1 Tax=Pisolithus microcarpus 441 TaxID=765257 RepID=A0A0C9XS80_9AGAM|nr:hypothetical protein PISMIDRAFT_16683 [Pisolithus microcarpus 441]